MSYCPYHQIPITRNQAVSVVEASQVPPENRSKNIQTQMPPSPPNGGLYGGPQATFPWSNIPVVPTATNLIHHNLRSANPPPGAINQYPGGQRKGNNYIAMSGVYWYNGDNPNNVNSEGNYRIMTTRKH